MPVKKNSIKTKKKNREREIVLACASFNLESYCEGDNEDLLKDLLSQGIEQTPALILATLGSKLWNPREEITMNHIKKEKRINHDYKPLIDAYKQFQEKGYDAIKAAFLAGGYVLQTTYSLDNFEAEFNKKEKPLLKLLE